MPKRTGRKSASQTPAPPSERISGSKVNPKGSASSEQSAKGITLSGKTIEALKNKLQKYKKENPKDKKVNINDLKAVFRRGAGAYSKSHRPTISGGEPNSRTAWAMARVNKFLKKAGGEKVKAAYVQDDDLMENGGETTKSELKVIIKNIKDITKKYQGTYKKIFDIIEENVVIYNPYGTTDENLIENDFHITITPRPDYKAIEKIKKLKDVVVLDDDLMEKGGKLMGKYAFADTFFYETDAWLVKSNYMKMKNAKEIQGVKKDEEANELEKLYIDKLADWVGAAKSSTANWFFKRTNEIQKLKKQYPKVFNAEKNAIVFRGLDTDDYVEHDKNLKKTLSNAKLDDFIKVKGKNDDFYLYLKPIEYKPKKNAESWTYNPTVAEDFGDSLLVTKIDDNFFMNYLVLQDIFHGNEKESIHLGKKYDNHVYILINEYEFETEILPKILNKNKINKSEIFKNISIENGGVVYGYDNFMAGGRTKKKSNEGGNCYYMAGQFTMGMFAPKKIDYIGTPYLVHAEVQGQGAISHLRYGHAWVEDDVMVYDFSNDRELIIPKALYYAVGDIDVSNPKKYRKYTFEEARRKMVSTGTYGCWDIEVDYEKGGMTDEDKKSTYKKWKSLVNMSKSELERFYESEEGKEAGLSAQEARSQGINSGRESARWIMRMKDTPVKEWTPDMWRWANKQISFISRMSGNRGGLYDGKGNKTRKHLSLLIWGHNPKK